MAQGGELAGRRVADFNPDSGTLTIPRQQGKARHVVLAEEGQRFFAAAAGRASDDTIFRRAARLRDSGISYCGIG